MAFVFLIDASRRLSEWGRKIFIPILGAFLASASFLVVVALGSTLSIPFIVDENTIGGTASLLIGVWSGCLAVSIAILGVILFTSVRKWWKVFQGKEKKEEKEKV